jgi:hypothetical protein
VRHASRHDRHARQREGDDDAKLRDEWRACLAALGVGRGRTALPPPHSQCPHSCGSWGVFSTSRTRPRKVGDAASALVQFG